jgi:PAS domain S-box-containing protein
LALTHDVAGKGHTGLGLAHQLSQVSTVPVFGLFEDALGYGVTGGTLISWDLIGKRAGQLVIDILKGVKTLDDVLPVLDVPSVPMFDWRQLRRWNLSEAALPKGSIVINREVTFWDFKYYIICGIFFIITETLLIIGLLVNFRKLKRAEGEIAASALRYRTVADHTYDWEYWSAPDGTLNYVSPSCERITGYSAQEFIDDPSLLTGIIVLEDNIAWNNHDHDARTGSKSREIQFRIRTRSGEIRWIDHACQPVNDAQGKSLGIRASNRDITDRRKAEIETQQHRNELFRVNRVVAMGELTSSLAHELNQPLTAIRNYANAAQRLLSQDEPDLSKAREALEGIVRDNRRAVEVISGVRRLLKKEEPRYGSVHMNTVIQEILALIRSDSLLEGLFIETGFAPGLPSVPGNRVQLQQVLLNLILNAAAAMDETKADLRKIVIKTEKHEDRGVKVSVRDSGAGIDEARKDKLFEPFYTTKPGGMGMGLAISESIIHAHGGLIWAENNPDGGATFSFTLPISRDTEMGI